MLRIFSNGFLISFFALSLMLTNLSYAKESSQPIGKVDLLTIDDLTNIAEKCTQENKELREKLAELKRPKALLFFDEGEVVWFVIGLGVGAVAFR